MINRILTLLFVVVSMTSTAQTVQFEFVKWGNIPRREQISGTIDRLTDILSRRGFNDHDTIRVVFNLRAEHIVVKSNRPDASRDLYHGVVMYAYDLHQTVPMPRLQYFRWLIHAGGDMYYRTNHSTLSLDNRARKTRL